MSKVSSQKQLQQTRKSQILPILTTKSLHICTLMKDLILIRKFHEHKLLTLNPQNLQQLEIHQKTLKFIIGNIVKNTGGCARVDSNTKINYNGMKRGSLGKTNNVYQDQEKIIEEKKVSQSEANLLFMGVYQNMEEDIRNWYYLFRMQVTDIMAVFAKFKLTDEILSNKALKDISDIMDKYHYDNHQQKSHIFLESNQTVLFSQKNQLLYYNLTTLTQKSRRILSSLPFYKQYLQNSKTDCLSSLIQTICKYYKIVPYHNFTHAFAVFISFYDLTKIVSIGCCFDDLSLFFVLIACLAHDVGHSGRNTLYEVKVRSQLAVMYGQISVMEKMHLAVTMEILARKPETCQIFQSLSDKDKIRARKIISRAILATDMSKHYSFIEKLETKTTKTITENNNNNNNKEQQQLLFNIEILIHACDIQNPSFQHNCYLEWANLICLQFHMQTEKQKQLKIEVTEFMKFDSLTYFYKNQISFTSSIVLPLWLNLQLKFQGLADKKICQKIKINLTLLSEYIRRNSEVTSRQTTLAMQEFVSGKLEYIRNSK